MLGLVTTGQRYSLPLSCLLCQLFRLLNLMMIIDFVSGMLCISDNAASIEALMAIIVEAGAHGLTCKRT